MLNAEDGDDVLRYHADSVWSAGAARTSPIDGAPVPLEGLNRSHDEFDGGLGVDTLILTDGADALLGQDAISPAHPQASGTRVTDVEKVLAGLGNDLIDLTDLGAGESVSVEGGEGDDSIWTGAGDDQIDVGIGTDSAFGGLGSDEFFYDLGYGVDFFDGGDDDSGPLNFDEVVFGAGITPGLFSLSDLGNDTYEFDFLGTDDFLTTYRMDSVRFADGTTLALSTEETPSGQAPLPGTLWLMLAGAGIWYRRRTHLAARQSPAQT
ncbi:hypothetical protein DEM34_15120 [Spiribacter halobius]|uniref:Uncharacterized protein n=1 Tax=Sediminicurvatus halobius TaxID=2182432 RepID=A0A2U2MY87_9GAMM|nr:hypothetical protein DEM34_15120 [Spiribacter halobius]